MSEISICFSKMERDLFLTFWKKFESSIVNFKNVSINNQGDEIVVVLYVANKKKLFLESILKNILADCIVVYYKTNYFEKNFNVPINFNIEIKSLYKALAVFDKKNDISYVESELFISKNLNVKSFYEFRLTKLRERWDEIIALLQENFCYIMQSDSFVELIRYLIDTTDNEYEQVFLYENNNFINIRDNIGNDLTSPISTQQENLAMLVIAELIALAPKNIIIKFSQNKNEELLQSLSNLFMEKVSY